jgi:hypothetical protein
VPTEYDTEGRLKLRKATSNTSIKEFGPAMLALGDDIESHLLGFVSHAASVTATVGELLKMTATATVTLPAVAENALVGVFCSGGETTIKTASGNILGDFITGAASIKLLLNQHVILQSDGTNWYIIAGEPKREASYVPFKEPGLAAAEAGIEVSPTREADVIVGGNTGAIFANGVEIRTAAEGNSPLSFVLGPGQKWKANASYRWTFRLR